MTERINTHALLAKLPCKNDARLYRAPGRVNIIGEHTDYTGGLVLPTNSAIYTWVAAEARSDPVFTITTVDLDQRHSFSLDDPGTGLSGEWHDYVVGVLSELAASKLIDQGANLVLQTEIPMGGGLSSSAALELAVAVAALDLNGRTVPGEKLAGICQQAEHKFVGTKCGILDQFAVVNCRKGQAMLLDCHDLSTKHVSIPDDIRFLLVDSGVKHQHATGHYNTRADECANATRILREKNSDLEGIRDLDETEISDYEKVLGHTLFRRCRHVVTENARVRSAFSALADADSAELGSILSGSHVSLRDDYEASCDEVDLLVDIANRCDGVLGSRMVGGGFGGCVLAVVEVDKVQQVTSAICRQYRTPGGSEPWTHAVQPAEAAQRVVNA